MKIKLLFIGALTLLSTLFSSCEDDDVVVVDPDDAYTDAQNAIAVSLAYQAYGMVANINYAAETLIDHAECDKPYSKSDTLDGEMPWHYGHYTYYCAENYLVPCSDTQPIEYGLEAKQVFEGHRSYEHHIALAFTVDGKSSNANDQVFNGMYKREGGLDAVESVNSYQFAFESELQDVYLSKQSDKIYRGTADFTLTENYGSSSPTYTYHGQVEFVNENEAKVVFDEGETFTVNLHNLSITEH